MGWAPWEQSPTQVSRSRRALEKKLSRMRVAGQEEEGAVTAKSSLGLIHRGLWGMHSPTELSTLREEGWASGPQSQSVSNPLMGGERWQRQSASGCARDGTISPRL